MAALTFQNLALIPCEATVTIDDDWNMVFNNHAQFGIEIPRNSYKYLQQLNVTVHQKDHWTVEPRALSHNGLWPRIEINTKPRDLIRAQIESLIKEYNDPYFKPLVEEELSRQHITLIQRSKSRGLGRPAKVDW